MLTNQIETIKVGYDASSLSIKHKFKIITSFDQQAEKRSYRNYHGMEFLYKISKILHVHVWEFLALETSTSMFDVLASAIDGTCVTNNVTSVESGSKCLNTLMNCKQGAIKHEQKF